MKKKVKEKKVKEVNNLYGWKPLFKTIKDLRLPWLWIIFGLALNLVANYYLLELPDTTADLVAGNLDATSVMKAVMFYVLLGVTGTLAVAGQVQAQSYGVRKARESVWKKMLKIKMDFFDRNDPSDLMSAVTTDTGTAVESFINVLIYLIPNLYYVVMALKRIGEYHWVLALSCFALIPLKYLYTFVIGKKYQVSTSYLYSQIGTLSGFLSDRILHLPLIKAYGKEKKEGATGEDAANKLFKVNMKLVNLDNAYLAVSSVLEVLQKFVVVIVAVILLQKKQIDLAMWLAFFLFSQNLFSYIDQLFSSWIGLKTIQGTFQRVIEIMQAGEEEVGTDKTFSETGDIKFENVTFTYPETEKPALKNVSFEVKRGSCVAIVGLCGSGKTTSISLFERLYAADEGRVLIGDTDIKEFSLSDFRRHIAYVQQGTDVFSGTLREALTYGIDREVADSEIFSAAKLTGFDEYLGLCDNNLDTQIAPGASSMSGGQSQRLILTREFLRGGDIILMDEPTSALDVRVSEKIQNTMDEIFSDKTRILVTHDLTFAKKYDKIVVMRDGELVAEGTHDELLNTCQMYREMNENTGMEATV